MMKCFSLFIPVVMIASATAGAIPIDIASGCKIDESKLSYTGQLHYAVTSHHPRGSISSSSNYQSLDAFTFEAGRGTIQQSCTIGSFTNQPDKYDMYYSAVDKPPAGSSHYTLYAGTVYDGLYDTLKYASGGKQALIDVLIDAVATDEAWLVPANFAGGNLNRNDNFWVYFLPKQGLIDYVNSTIIESFAPTPTPTPTPVPPAIWLFGIGLLVLAQMRRIETKRGCMA